MLEFAQEFLRKRSIKKLHSTIPTGIVPLKDIHSAVIFIDVEDTSFDECKILVQSFLRDYDIKGEIFFFDFRKLGDGERLITSITGTILKKDLNWFGKPSNEKLRLMNVNKPDLFISLINRTDFTLEVVAACSQARFKIGRQQLPGNIFDMVILDPADRTLSEAESFKAMRTYLSKIA